MSSAPSKSPPSPEPTFDLAYSVHDFEVSPHRDNQFLTRCMEKALLAETAAPGTRTLDVACGVGQLTARLHRVGCESVGLEPSPEMAGVSRWLYPAEQVVLVRGIAEALPFRSESFDRILCQGSLDHFVDPRAFMREARRLLRPGGRVIIALANYESLSCRIGRAAAQLQRRLLRRSRPPHRPYWQPPPDHLHMGDLPFVRTLGGAALDLERCYGISLLWLVSGWGRWLDGQPRFVAEALLRTLNRCARPLPLFADMIVSVWRPAGAVDAA